ncbi:MAG: c-type cytochrome [Bacteroidetes bacterium]|nr:c-type cytochrome [Bacteroidota bacterium]
MKNKFFTTILFLVSSTAVMAQETGPVAQKASETLPKIVTDPLNYIIAFSFLVMIGAILVLMRVIRILTDELAPKKIVASEPGQVAEIVAKKPSFWTKLGQSFNDSVPVENEADVLLDHNYDGIKELDNNLPPWWKYGFYLTIIFAVIYMVDYHVVGAGNVQLDEYNAQLAEAELQKAERLKLVANNVDESTVTYLTEETAIANGNKIYVDKCLVCHGKAGEGIVGPNLTDEYWIHGGAAGDIFKTIKYGVPSKGMLAWQGQLTPVQIQEVTSFIHTLKGTKPANAKAPQGDLYTEVSTTAAPTDSASTRVTDSTATAVN